VSTNVLRHAGRGELLLNPLNHGASGLELIALDRGPGMNDTARCLTDGFSTAGSAGEGLGAIVRASDVSDIWSQPGKGTAVLARWLNGKPPVTNSRSPLQIGAVNVSKRGEELCGDSWGVEQNEDYCTLLLADGLGHGYHANAASQQAVRTLRANPTLAPLLLIECIHGALRSSRGAAAAVARIDRNRGKLTFCGVGNISAQIYAGSEPGPRLVSVNGTMGHQSQRMKEFSYPWPQDGMLVIYSDGLSSAAGLQNQAGLARRDPSLIAGVLYRDFSRGQDDATVLVARAV
jgi:hypothetical protein